MCFALVFAVEKVQFDDLHRYLQVSAPENRKGFSHICFV